MSDAGNEEETVIRIRGLPWSATKQDIINFFEGVDIRNGEKGIHLTLSPDGRPSGEAYLELENEDDIPNAEKKHNAHMGRRYIEVFTAKRSEMEWVIKRASTGPSNEDDCCVRLRGIPFGCSKEEIMQFFSGLEIVPNGIALPTDFQGRHTGDAYVQFVDKETTERAMEKHKQKIAHRYIEIFRSSIREINMSMNNRGMRGGSGMGGMGMGGGSMGSSMGFNRPSPYDRGDRYGGVNRYGMGGGMGGRGGRSSSFGGSGGYNDYGGVSPWSSGGGGGSFGSFNDFRSRIGAMGGMRGPGSFSNRLSSMDGGRNGYDGGGGGSGQYCVHMRGLPYKATESDIREFFYPLNALHVKLITDSSGRPSGEANVEFACHDDAVKAMGKHKMNMQNRYIELFLNSFPMGGGGGGMGGMGGSGW